MSSLFLCNKSEPFLNHMVMCDEKWILYDNWWQPARWLDWEEAPKHFPQPNLHQKEVLVTVWWFAVSRMYYGFLNPCKTITAETFAEQIDEIHWKLQCLQPTLVNRKGPNSSPWQCLLISDCTLHNQCFKSRMNWATSFASSTIFTWPLANWYHFFKHLNNFEGRENTSTTSRRQKMLPKSLSNPEEWIFMLQE